MSKAVISGITCTYGSITGNVSSISSTTTTVLDQTDLNSAESRLNRRINSLENQVMELREMNETLNETLKSVILKYGQLSEKLVSEIREVILDGNKDFADILDKEMR